MSVQVGVPSNFNAVLQDNGAAIPLPAGSTFQWSTDNDTDQITILTEDTENVQILVTANGSSRTSVTVTAATTAPDGSAVTGNVTVDLIPGAPTHVFTVSVSQVFATPAHQKASKKK